MSFRRTTITLILAAACVLAVLGSAPRAARAASTSNPVIADCLAHPGGLTGQYTVAQLRNALQVMPAETKEYTSCPDVVNRALLAALGTGTATTGTTGGGSSSFLPTPVIIVLVVLVLAAVTFGAIAVRRRQEGGASGAARERPAGDDDPGTETPAGTSPAGDPDD